MRLSLNVFKISEINNEGYNVKTVLFSLVGSEIVHFGKLQQEAYQEFPLSGI